MAEYYLRNTVGLLSAGIFTKALNDLQYTRKSTINGGSYDGWTLSRPENSDAGTIFGVELGYEQNLTMLPGALSGIGLSANYTFTSSTTEIERADGKAETVQVQDQAPHTFNTSLSYDKYGIFARLALHTQSSTVESYGDEKEMDVWYAGDTRLDLNVAYRIGQWEFWADFVNLLNSPERTYYKANDKEYTNFMESYSWWSKFGVTFSL